jgi:hypothetical protein
MLFAVLVALPGAIYGQEILGYQKSVQVEHWFSGLTRPRAGSQFVTNQAPAVAGTFAPTVGFRTLSFPAYNYQIPEATGEDRSLEFFPDFNPNLVDCLTTVTVDPLDLQIEPIILDTFVIVQQFPLIVPNQLTGSWTIRCGPIDTSGNFSIPLDKSTVIYQGPFITNWFEGFPAGFEARVVIDLRSTALEQILYVGEGRVFQYDLSFLSAEILGHAPCDLNQDLRCPDGDIDALSVAILEQNTDARFDLTHDGALDLRDHEYYRTAILKTVPGDANLDRHFNSQDLVLALQAGRYEDTTLNNSTWATGDWNGDLEFDTSDLIAAFQTGSYERAASAILVVPEPSSLVFIWMICAAIKRSLRASQLNRH